MYQGRRDFFCADAQQGDGERKKLSTAWRVSRGGSDFEPQRVGLPSERPTLSQSPSPPAYSVPQALLALWHCPPASALHCAAEQTPSAKVTLLRYYVAAHSLQDVHKVQFGLDVDCLTALEISDLPSINPLYSYLQQNYPMFVR